MIDHVSLHVSDIERAKDFYSKALKPLGYEKTGEFPEWTVVGYGVSGKSDFWLTGDGALQKGHVSFAAENKGIVDKFYDAGIEAGGKDNGKPGYRKDYSPGYYAAFVHDPDGHNIEVVYHDPNPKE